MESYILCLRRWGATDNFHISMPEVYYSLCPEGARGKVRPGDDLPRRLMTRGQTVFLPTFLQDRRHWCLLALVPSTTRPPHRLLVWDSEPRSGAWYAERLERLQASLTEATGEAWGVPELMPGLRQTGNDCAVLTLQHLEGLYRHRHRIAWQRPEVVGASEWLDPPADRWPPERLRHRLRAFLEGLRSLPGPSERAHWVDRYPFLLTTGVHIADLELEDRERKRRR